MKKLVEFAVKFPITVFMLVLGIILLGYISFERLGIDLFPNLNNPRLYIKLVVGDRPPEEIEKNYTDFLESLAIRQSDVVNISSTTKVGSALITVEYNWEKDMDEAFLDLQKNISSATQSWDVDELTITQYDPNSSPILTVALTNENITDMSDLRKTAENYIRNEIIRLEGIADVEISGGEKKEVLISTTQFALDAHNLTIDNLKTQIQKFNRNVSGGTVVEMGTQYIIKGVSIYSTPEDFNKAIVAYKRSNNDTAASTPIFLEDIAEVKYTNQDPENIVYFNGNRAVGLSIYKETKYNTVKAAEELNDELLKLQKALPGYKFTVIENQAEFISSAIDEVEESAIIGIILAVLILYIFLRRFGVTLIISTAIPISIIATFNLMYFNHLTLNIMTLGGLALGAGMLVDNAIVVMENIYRNLELGMSIKESAIKGTSQVGGAITASTVTTIIVFLPIVYLHGASGELFKDQAWTVAFSLISSLFVAIMLLPVLSIKILSSKTKLLQTSIKFNWYKTLLKKIIDKRILVIIASILLIASAGLLLPFVGSEFMPKTSSHKATLNLTLAEGTDIERTASTINNITRLIKEFNKENVTSIYSQAGPSTGIDDGTSSFFENENTGFIKITFNKEKNFSQAEIVNNFSKLLNNISGLEYTITFDEASLESITGNDVQPIVVEIKGDDLETLEDLTNQAKSIIANNNNLTNVESSFENGAPEIEVEVDRIKAGMYGVGVEEISSQLADVLEGANSGTWDYDGELNDITIKLPDVSVKDIANIKIISSQREFRLSELASISYTTSPREILRRNQSRIGKVTAEIRDNTSFNKIVNKLKLELAQVDLPINYSIKITGEEELREESMTNLTFALFLSIILVYMALASQFESLLHPFTILLTIPLAGVGAVYIFAILGQSFNIMAYIGIIMLVGIAVNDSIILVDAILQLQNQGMERKKAILTAGQNRIRPIIMTSLTTILALLPLTIGFGEGASLRAPMALAVIGGLVSSTLLTLVVIPCVFYLFDVAKEKLVIKIFKTL